MAQVQQNDELLGTRFAELAQVTAGRKDLSEFGKCCALFIAAAAMALENGYPLTELDELFANTKLAVMATATQVVSEGSPDVRD
jgi:hypothetical protein